MFVRLYKAKTKNKKNKNKGERTKAKKVSKTDQHQENRG
jgi:hypothetical protein